MCFEKIPWKSNNEVLISIQQNGRNKLLYENTLKNMIAMERDINTIIGISAYYNRKF